MVAFTGTADDGSEIVYIDRKRHLWWLGFLSPAIFISAIWLYFAFDNNPIFTLIPFLYTYAFNPLMDKIMGVDEHNPPEEVAASMSLDAYYRFHVHIRIPIAIAIFIAYVWFVGTQDLPWWSIVALIVGVGTASGGIMTLTHELGHKSNKWDRLHAKIGNIIIGYGHFNIEHNKGHHTWVSTPEDPASARMGENIYRFALREISGTVRRGLHHEKKRLAAQGRGFWSIHNDVLQVYGATLIIMIGFAFLYGPAILWFLIPHHMLGWYTLTQANYVEHYGLLRQKKPNGKYERTEPHHSWNTNHTFSNMMLFHLQRHSDHHAHPQRPYQVLRNFDDLPSLPSGYGGCFALAAIPPLWYKVMDKKVMEWAGGDITKVNIDPKNKDRLTRKWANTGDMVAAE
jgi:alkane 1-monooxygenase